MLKEINKLVELLKEDDDHNAVLFFDELVANNTLKDYHEHINYMPVCARSHDAITIDDTFLGYNTNGQFTLHAKVHEDYYTWINFFVAVFDDGINWVVGDYESIVFASNEETVKVFEKNIIIENWDYYDI